MNPARWSRNQSLAAIGVKERAGVVRRSCAKVARLHAVGQVSDLPVAASLRARPRGT